MAPWTGCMTTWKSVSIADWSFSVTDCLVFQWTRQLREIEPVKYHSITDTIWHTASKGNFLRKIEDNTKLAAPGTWQILTLSHDKTWLSIFNQDKNWWHSHTRINNVHELCISQAFHSWILSFNLGMSNAENRGFSLQGKCTKILNTLFYTFWFKFWFLCNHFFKY